MAKIKVQNGLGPRMEVQGLGLNKLSPDVDSPFFPNYMDETLTAAKVVRPPLLPLHQSSSTPRLSLLTSSPVVSTNFGSRRPSDLLLVPPGSAAGLLPLGGGKFGPEQQARRRKSNLSFNEKYVLTGKELGKGSTASVNLCQDVSTGTEYAVKIIAKSLDERQSKRIHREIKTFQLTNGHPNVCQLIEFFEDATMYYSIFEKMEGGSLLNQIERKMVFTEAEASLVTRDVTCALEFLHSLGIAHRDLKPENVLCKYNHTMVPVKISDFDLASDSHLDGSPTYPVHTPELTTPVGSAEFMAPEVVKTYNGEAHHYDKRCDMWSLGVIIYIMHCGYPPFYGQCGASSCGWVMGGFCQECQDMLFERIQKGHFDFPDPDWRHISPAAKDLIGRLLIKDSRKRFTPCDVLNHDWIKYPAPSTVLETPDVLKRTNSTGSLNKFTQNAIAVNRMIQQCYAIHTDILETGPQYEPNHCAYFDNGIQLGGLASPPPYRQKNENSCSEEDDEEATPFGSCVDASGSFFMGNQPIVLPKSPNTTMDNSPNLGLSFFHNGYNVTMAPGGPQNSIRNDFPPNYSNLPYLNYGYLNCLTGCLPFPSPYKFDQQYHNNSGVNIFDMHHQLSPMRAPTQNNSQTELNLLAGKVPLLETNDGPFVNFARELPSNTSTQNSFVKNVPANMVASPAKTSPRSCLNKDKIPFYLAASHFEEGLKERRASIEELEENRANLSAKLRVMNVGAAAQNSNTNEGKPGPNLTKRGLGQQYPCLNISSKPISTATPPNGPIRCQSPCALQESMLLKNPNHSPIVMPPHIYNNYLAGMASIDPSIPHLAWILNERLRDLTLQKKAAH